MVVLEAVSHLLWDKNPEISSDLSRWTYSILKELSPNITSSSFKKACHLVLNFLYIWKVALLYDLLLEEDLELESPVPSPHGPGSQPVCRRGGGHGAGHSPVGPLDIRGS